MNFRANTFRDLQYIETNGVDQQSATRYTPTVYHEQRFPPHWEKYKSLYSQHYHLTGRLLHFSSEDRRDAQRSWYKTLQETNERLDTIAMQILQ